MELSLAIKAIRFLLKGIQFFLDKQGGYLTRVPNH
jgi:hypothetical protein